MFTIGHDLICSYYGHLVSCQSPPTSAPDALGIFFSSVTPTFTLRPVLTPDTPHPLHSHTCFPFPHYLSKHTAAPDFYTFAFFFHALHDMTYAFNFFNSFTCFSFLLFCKHLHCLSVIIFHWLLLRLAQTRLAIALLC